MNGQRRSTRLIAIVGLALAIGLATTISPLASAQPDGLQRVAEQQGFAEQARVAPLQDDSPIPGYAFPGIEDERLARGLAGFAGTLAVFAFGYGLARLLRRRSGRAATPATR